MKKALFPGTFDPPTLGHLDLIQRASKLCDKLYIGIGHNSSKNKPLFTLSEKEELVKTITKDIRNAEVISFSGLVVECAQELKVDYLIRGLRTFSDFEYECQMAFANNKMTGIETLFLMADSQYAHLSSTLIKEIAHYKHRLTDFIPASIEEAVFNKLKD